MNCRDGESLILGDCKDEAVPFAHLEIGNCAIKDADGTFRSSAIDAGPEERVVANLRRLACINPEHIYWLSEQHTVREPGEK